MKRLASALAVIACFGFQITFGQSSRERDSSSAVSATTNGSIEGIVTFQGAVPKSAVPDDAGIRRDLLEVDPQTRGLRYAVIYLLQTNGSVLPTNAGAPSGPKLVMDQQNHAFTPRVVAVRAGEPVTFMNSDPANHNVRTSSSVAKNEFNVFTGSDGGKYVHRFVTEAGHRPVRLGCDIHPWMRGWIYVFEHGCFAVSDAQGRFRIGAVPPGTYKSSFNSRTFLTLPNVR